MTFDGEYFQQIFGVIMGMNVVQILANIYMATLENMLKEKCKTNKKIIWPLLFKRFIDDGFGIRKEINQILNIGFQNLIYCVILSQLTNLNTAIK